MSPTSAASKRKRSRTSQEVEISSTVKQACNACRKRKIRCDAERPRCAYCTSKAQDCIYTELFKRAQCSQQHVDVLESRVRELESALNNFEHQPSAVRCSTPGSLPIGRAFDGDQAKTPPILYQGRRGSSKPPVTESRGEAGGSLRKPSQVSERTQEPRRYGKSSTSHFALSLRASKFTKVPQATRSPDSQRRLSISSEFSEHSVPFASASPTQELSNEELPVPITPRPTNPNPPLPLYRVAVSLYLTYFQSIHLIWPILNEHQSWKDLDQLYASRKDLSPLGVAHCYLIMSLAAQYRQGSNENSDSSGFDTRPVFHHAEEIVNNNAFRPSVSLVQALLLLALYQQGALRPNNSYLAAGHAARVAQSLGLHISRSEMAPIAPQQRELQRRLWWSCFCLDRVSSMTTGRPFGIPYAQFSDYQDQLPREVDDGYIDGGEQQPMNVPSVNSFFRHTVRLFHVMDDVLQRLREAKTTAYFESKGVSADKGIRRPISSVNAALSLLNVIIQLDGHLLSWHEYLPSHLKFSINRVENPQKPPTWQERQRRVLQSRFLHMRVLLHRQTILFLLQPPDRISWPVNGIQEWPPIFSDCSVDSLVGASTVFREGGTPSTIETTLAHLSANICVSSAMLQIEAVEVVQSLESQREGWWWDFNFVFNALCVLCAALALPASEIRGAISNIGEAKNRVQRGIDIVKEITKTSGDPRIAKRQRFLQKLMQVVLHRSKDSCGRQDKPDAGTTNSTSGVPSWNPMACKATEATDNGGYGATHTSVTGVDLPHTLDTLAPTTTAMDMDISLEDMLTSWTPSLTQDGIGKDLVVPDYSENIGLLFHDSFNAWGAFDDLDSVQWDWMCI